MEETLTVFCLDPGHPSEVGRGAAGRRITEIRAAWRVARRVQALLEQAGARVVLTKQSEQQLVRNRARAEAANHAHADLMVRLHCDSEGGSGFAVYVPEKPGVSAGVRGPSPEILRASAAAGRAFHAELARRLGAVLPDRGLLPDTATRIGAKQGALTGSVFSRVPVVLVEMCILSNPRDDAFMASEAGQEKMANAIAAAALAATRAARQPSLPR